MNVPAQRKPSKTSPESDLLDLPALLRMLGISKATLARIKDFPKPIKMGRQNRWWRPTIISYLEAKAKALLPAPVPPC